MSEDVFKDAGPLGSGACALRVSADGDRSVVISPNEARALLAHLDAAADLLEALKAMRTMMDRGPQPRKFDEALTWRQNDERAREMADAAIARAEATDTETER